MLHNQLKVSRDFTTWIKKQIEDMELIENIEYKFDSPLKVNQNIKGGDRRSLDYLIQVSIAKEIPIVLGGFGDGKKCICDKTIAEIHDMGAFKVRERISSNISRFRENVDFIDLKQGILATDTCENKGMGESHTLSIVLELGYTKSAITQAEHIYLLSERGGV